MEWPEFISQFLVADSKTNLTDVSQIEFVEFKTSERITLLIKLKPEMKELLELNL